MKYVPYFILILLIYNVISHFTINEYIIPNEAIRVRVIANSNDKYDTKVKMNVKDIVTSDMYNILKDTKSIQEARSIINNNINNLDADINKYLNSINYNKDYDINFGYNYFPEKKYKGIKYP